MKRESGWVAVLAAVVLAVTSVGMVALAVSEPDPVSVQPAPTVTRLVPGPVVTVTVTAEPSPAPTVTVTREAVVSRSRPSASVHTVNRSVSAFLACVVAHESGGDPKAENPTSTASGLYQFLNGTWQAYARESGIGDQYRRASSAPASVQTALAEWVVINKGKYPWRGTGCGGGT